MFGLLAADEVDPAVYMVIGFGVLGMIGYAIGKPKGLGGVGFVLGALLNVIGWIIVACMQGTKQSSIARVSPTAGVGSMPVGWHPDPIQRYTWRYFDGARWTDNVSTDGQTAVDAADGWHSDPTGRAQYRLFQQGWTQYVSTNGNVTVEQLGPLADMGRH